jgi:hypothetical protein
MNKLKMLALTAMAAATIGTGALATAPAASAQPSNDCRYYLDRYRYYMNEAGWAVAHGSWGYAKYASENAQYYGMLAGFEC